MIKEKLVQTAKILVLGDPQSGKKSIIKSLQKQAEIEGFLQKDDIDSIEDLQKVYIMDFYYMNYSKTEKDSKKKLGTLNFYIFNKRFDFMADFFTKSMLNNLVVIIVIDLTRPETIREQANK